MMRALVFRCLVLLPAVATAFFAAPARAQATGEVPVHLSVSVNEGVAAEAPQGWPLLVTATLLHADAFAETAVPVVVAAVDGSWTNAVRLTLRDAAGAVAPLPLLRTTQDTGSLTLDAETAGEVTWVASGEAVAALAPGPYTLEAVVPADALGRPGSAPVASVPAVVHVVAAPSGTPAQQQEALQVRRARYEAARGEPGNALVHDDQLLAAQPALPMAHFLRGQLLEALAEPWDALEAYEEALRLVPAEHPEPPVFIAGAMHALVRDLENATAFEVTALAKPASHPFAGQGSGHAFALDGIPGRELYLERGTTYTFRIAEVPAATPFALATTAAGTTPYTEGVSGGLPASGTTEVTFTPGPQTPDLLYYGSPSEPMMGWRLRIRGGETPTSDEPEPDVPSPGAFELSPVYPNPFREQARLTLRVAQTQHVTVDVFDVLGRRIDRLYAGPLQAGEARACLLAAEGLANGMYLVRVTGETFTAVRTVTLAR